MRRCSRQGSEQQEVDAPVEFCSEMVLIKSEVGQIRSLVNHIITIAKSKMWTL